MTARRRSEAGGLSVRRWHWLCIAAVGVVYDLQFLYEAPNPVDEGWPLYAAKRLHEGGTLYADTFFVFPPGHLLSAWLGYAIAPPGLEWARIFYAAFDVALCLALYAFGRRWMPARFALLAALLLALATYRAHAHHNIFGYRYLVWSVLALVAFARSLQYEDRRWLFAAGVLAGVGTSFRLTPGFAVSVAIGLSLLTRPGGPQRWLRDAAAYAAGVLAVLTPVIAWLAIDVDLGTLWREIVVRPVVMTDLQSLPLPPLVDPELSGRAAWTASFVGFQFRFYPLLLGGYGVALARMGWRARAEGRRFAEPDEALFLCAWLFALVYFTRTLGRSDEAHLVSALPPLCLLLGHALSRVRLPAVLDTRAVFVPGVVVLAIWSGLWGADRAFAPLLRDLTGIASEDAPGWVEQRAGLRTSQASARERIERGGAPRVLLDLSSRPLLYTTGEFTGPGWFDVVMPGTFMSGDEEQAFVDRLAAAPPTGVFWPAEPFDSIPERAVERTAPRLRAWAASVYGEP